MPKSILSLLCALILTACDSPPSDINLVTDDAPEVTLQAFAGADQQVNEGEQVVLEGSGEVSDANISLSYSWEQIGGSAVSLSGADSRVVSFTAAVDLDAKLTFHLLVRTESGLEDRDELVVSVNNAPTAIIAAVSSIEEGLGVSLDGWPSVDSDGGSIVSYAWTQLGGKTVELIHQDRATVSFVAPLVGSDENFSFELAVTDNDGAIGRSTAVVEVLNDKYSPIISAVYLATGDYGIGASITITLEVAGAETGLALKAGSSFHGQELTDFTPVPGQDGNYTAVYTVVDTNPSLANGESASANIVLVDIAGNESAAVTSVLLEGTSIDTVLPELGRVIVSEGYHGIGARVKLTFQVAYFENDLSLSADSTFNGRELSYFAAVADKNGYYTATYTVLSGDQDRSPGTEASASLVVVDLAGNESPEYGSVILNANTSIDAHAPIISSVSAASGAYGIGDDIQISITAADSESTLTLSSSASSFNGSTLSQFAHVASGVYSAVYTVAEGDIDIDVNSSVDINIALADANGNISAALSSVQLSDTSIDATRPQLSVLSIADGTYAIGSDLVISLSAAEDEIGLELQDSTFNGSSLAGFNDQQNGFYALTYTVAAGDPDQARGAEVAADIVLADAVGNTSPSITTISLLGASIDANAPVIESISVGEGAYLAGDELLVFINAANSETDLQLRSGSSFNGQELSNFRAVDNGQGEYFATYTVSEGDVSVDVDGSVLSDIALLDPAGNLSSAVATVDIGAQTTIGPKSISISSVTITPGAHRIGSSVVVSIVTADGDAKLLLQEGSRFNGQLLTDFTAIAGDDGAYEANYTVTAGDPDVAAGGAVGAAITLVDTAGNASNHYTSISLNADTSIDANTPEISALTVAAGAHGVGDAIEINISTLNADTGLSLAAGSSFNGRELTGFSGVDGQDGDYLVTYTVAEGDSDVADGAAVATNLALEDASGNVGAAEDSLVLSGSSIDANSPTIASVSVAPGTHIVGDRVVITITAGGVDNDLTLEPGSSFHGQELSDFSRASADSVYTAIYTVAVEDVSLGDGDSVDLNIVLVDAGGNPSAAVTEVVLSGTSVDTSVPSIYDVLVAADNIINGNDDLTSISVTGSTSSVEDGQPIALTIGGISSVATVSADSANNGGFSTTIDLSALSDGTHQLTIDVADISGNEAQVTGEFIKDTEVPAIDSVSVSGDDVINSSDSLDAVAISVVTTDVDDGQVVSLDIGGVTAYISITSNGFDGTVNLSGLDDGTEIVVRGDVSDAAGNAADTFTKDSFVLKDTIAPSMDSILVAGDNVVNSSEKSSSVAVSGTTTGVEDNQPITLTINGDNITTDVTGNAFTTTADLSTLGEGTYDLTANVADVAGNPAAPVDFSFEIDTTAPTISISDVTAAEASVATLDASGSSDSSGIASYTWTQVASDGSAWADSSTALSITNASTATTTVSTPGIADDSGADQEFYFAVTITDEAGNGVTSSPPLTLTVTNTYQTPDITASTPDSNQISLSWSAETNLIYSLYRSTDLDCVNALESITNIDSSCANGAIYTGGGNEPSISINSGTASITDTNVAADTIYYYWLEAQLDSEVVSLNTYPIQVATTTPPAVDAGRANSQAIGTIASLRGSATAEDGKGIKSYLWKETTSFGITIDRADTANASFTVPDTLAVGDVLSFQLTAIDSDGARTSATTSIAIADPGSQKWYFGDGSRVKSSPAIGADGTVYFGADDGKLYALNPQDGSLQWTFSTDNAIKTPPTIGADGTVYFASDDKNLYAVSPPTDGTQSGVEEWSRSVGTIYSEHTSVSITADGTLYYASSDKYFYALNPANGSVIWSSGPSDDVSMTKPAINSSGTIYFAGGGKKIYAIDPSSSVGDSREYLWTFTTGYSHSWASPAIGADGTVYNGGWGNNNGVLYALDSNGSLEWDYNPGGVRTSPAIAVDGTIYFGITGKYLFAFDADGGKKWSYRTGSNVNSSPVIGADGTVYVGSNDFNVSAIDPDNVTDSDNVVPEWEISTNGKVSYSSPALAPDGTLFIGSADGLYAIHTASAGLAAASPWPKFGQNNRNSGRVNLAPTADAGDNQTLSAGATVTLYASASTDTDGNIIDYYWRETSSYGISIANNNSAQASFTAPNSANDPITIELTVTDDHGATDTHTVAIHTVTIKIE